MSNVRFPDVRAKGVGGRGTVARRRALAQGILLWAILCPWGGTAGGSTNTARALTLQQLREWVTARNESVQMRLLEVEISKRTSQAERGVFEPQIVGSFERVDNARQNNAQQYANLGLSARTEFFERNTIYDGGLEFLVPTGTRLRTGYTLRELNNNLQDEGTDFETFVGVRLVQPLLKNLGPAATMARIRLAALASDVAFQEYRRQLMLSLAQAESGYWDLYLTQEQEQLTGDSLKTAEKVLADNRARVEVGKASELEVLQAEAGAALRHTRLNEARQRVYEAGTRLGSSYAQTNTETEGPPRAADEPDLTVKPYTRGEGWLLAMGNNPDYLARIAQLKQERVRLKYSENQRMPQLDLKASYGLNGLGETPGGAWDDVAYADYPSWSLGLELRIPVGGGVRERHELAAARLGKEKALLGLKEAETQILNSLDASWRKVSLFRDNVTNYQSVAEFHQKLLEAQLARLAVGALDSKTVLETEEKLFEARVAVVESLALFRKALLELELVRGTLLRDRDLEVDRAQLKARTEQLLERTRLSREAVDAYQRRVVESLAGDGVDR